jgi:GTP-binding protein
LFIDLVNIYVKSGDGGDGVVSFHRDKYTASGGPDGGNGGGGGAIIFQGDNNLSALENFRYRKTFFAQNGKNGEPDRRTGRSADDLIIKVPVGTLVKERLTDKIIADVSTTDCYIIVKGGSGGLGNACFSNSVRQSPRFCKTGEKTEKIEITLELKLLADVGIIGFPNVGKSTLISVISNARPTIANYHFTTLSPKLGVVKYSSENTFVVADIPGLVEGAHKGLGLGHKFLRHVERCRMLVHLVDVSAGEGRDPVEDFKIINNELEKFNKKLCDLPMIVVGSKCDIASEKQISDFKKYIEKNGYMFLAIASTYKAKIENLLDKIAESLSKLPPVKRFSVESTLENRDILSDDIISIDKNGDEYVVKSKRAEKIIDSVNFDDYDSERYFQGVMAKLGLNDILKKAGAKNGDTVKIGEWEFELVE